MTDDNNPIAGAVTGSRQPPPPPGDPDDPLARALGRLPRNDKGNGERLRRRFGEDLLYVQEQGWFAWSGKHWDGSSGEEAVRLYAHRTVEAMRNEAARIETDGPWDGETPQDFDKRLDSAWKWSIASGNTQRIGAMIVEARPYLTLAPADMDSDARALNLQNGTLVLDGACETLRPHGRADRITRVLPVAFEPQAECPEFVAFMERILPDHDVRGFVQRFFGYCLTGLISEQLLVFLHGLGANGKSTLINVAALVLGEYAVTLPFASIQHDEWRRGGDATPDLARLPGARMVRASEPQQGARFDEGMVKSLTGGEPVLVRRLRHDFFEFAPEFKLVLSGNNRPQIRGQDEGIWRRLALVEFPVQLPPEERIKDYHVRLFRAEAPGILNWLLDGLRLYLDGGLCVPEAVLAATQLYRQDSNSASRFVSDCVVRAEGVTVRASDLYGAYCDWCKANAESPWSQRAFGLAMAERFERRTLGGGYVHYINIQLVNVPSLNTPDQAGPPLR